MAELKELCKYVSMKGDLMKLLQPYAYAKKWVGHLPLKEREMGISARL